MVGFAVGLGSFANGLTQGMQMAQQVKGALDAKKMRGIEKTATAEATAAREADIGAVIQVTPNSGDPLPFKVGDKSFGTKDEARNAAASQVGSVMDYYRTKTVPKLIEGYVELGQADKAQQLQSWMESEESNGITKDWARATRMAMLGDNKAAMRGFGKLFERLEPGSKYIGTEDVTEPVYEDIKDKDGKVTGRKEVGTKPVGMRLKLRNAEGEDFNHDFSGSEDMFRTAMFTLSPDKFAHRAMSEVDQATAARAVGAKSDREFGEKVQLEKLKAVTTDQRDQREFERDIAKSDRQFAQQGQRDAVLSGYRTNETATELQMRAALKLSEDSGDKPEDVRKSLETITKRMADTDMGFAKLSPEEQTQRAVQVLQQQRSSARGVISGGASTDGGKGAIPKLW
jgi:hypothetical protein